MVLKSLLISRLSFSPKATFRETVIFGVFLSWETLLNLWIFPVCPQLIVCIFCAPQDKPKDKRNSALSLGKGAQMAF